MKRLLLILLLLMLGFSVWYYIHKTQNRAMVDQGGEIEVFFCFIDNCSKVLVDNIGNGASCALYDLSQDIIISSLIDKNAKVVMDNANLDTNVYKLPLVRVDHDKGLMHNKFCVVDNITITGSYNPTKHHNQDNMLVIHSETIAKNYKKEFDELWSGVYGQGDSVVHPKVRVGDIEIENYFCPEDECEDHVNTVLLTANKSILVMVYGFTNKVLAKTLAMKFNQGIKIKVISDESQLSEFSQMFFLNRTGIMTKIYKGHSGRNRLHHKVFIIDDERVITGSANPTYSGYYKNDENILILQNKKIATKYKQEFERIWGEA
ncbi:MAG: phospholipase D-like domain-containing protein [Nanoarchaeota archaeon]